ncbi:MAG TPA: hypothetical protein VG407_06525 [Caulobacteraceae bacterium]|jgi:hypothetical protein|nr:hypothetical protein [Caulobacteraceae bacterium]
MKQSLLPFAVCALGIGLAIAAPAAAAPVVLTGPEHRLNAQEIRDLAKRELLWCDDFHAQNGSCDAVSLITLAPDGRLAETTTMLLSDGPRIQAFIGEVDDVEGDRVCSKVTAAQLPIAFTLEGKAVPSEASASLRDVLVNSLAELDGKTICQTFYRGSDPNKLREEVTVDGKRRKDLETVYQLHDGKDGFDLRPQVKGDADKGTKA